MQDGGLSTCEMSRKKLKKTVQNKSDRKRDIKYFFSCCWNNKQLWDEVFVFFRNNQDQSKRSTLIIPDNTKTESNGCIEENNDKRTVARNMAWHLSWK